jgi:DhnA family fructose-bisphosphate aldolase class Ia
VRWGLEAGNRKPYYEVEVKADINTDVVNIFGGDKDWLCETRERCEQSICAGAAGGCVGRAPGAGPGTD